MTTEAQLRAQTKYDKANTKQVHLKLNTTTDADIIARLAEVDSMQGYIKTLIRRDIATRAASLADSMLTK